MREALLCGCRVKIYVAAINTAWTDIAAVMSRPDRLLEINRTARKKDVITEVEI